MLYKPEHDLSGMSVCILTPHADYKCYASFCQSVANMIAFSWTFGLKVHTMGTTQRTVVDWARNDLARRALSHINETDGKPFTHFLWLDDDHIFRQDLAVRLADHKVDMVSALYYGRTQHLPVVYVKDFSDDKYKHFPLTDVPSCLFECDAVGFGAMLMHRRCLEVTPEPWFTIDFNAGEDIAFCVKAKENGVRIFCDGAYKIGHIGAPEIITQRHYDSYMSDHAEEFKDKVKVALGGKQVA